MIIRFNQAVSILNYIIKAYSSIYNNQYNSHTYYVTYNFHMCFEKVVIELYSIENHTINDIISIGFKFNYIF